MIKTYLKKHSTAIGIIVLMIIYLISHLYHLTNLPVFADEAIYIRWTQLIIDDWKQYLFFPLNDGKTPLMMWLMVPFQLWFKDPLYGGRLLSVLVGLIQVLISGHLIKILGGKKKAIWLTYLFTSLLPFWFFHHRMALIDGLLTLFLSLTFIGTIKILTTHKKMLWSLLTGLFFGLSMWTKLPALLILPSMGLALLTLSKNKKQILKNTFYLSLAFTLGLLIFILLKIHPAFSQLFGRGNDFLFPWKDVIINGFWLQTIKNIPNYLHYFGSYLTWPIVFLCLASLFFTDKKQPIFHLLFWSGILFITPIALLGKVVYPRYLFPASIFFTTSAVLSIEHIIDDYINQQKNISKKVILSAVLAIILANIITASLNFILPNWTNFTQIPFVSADKEQYLLEWSSGIGIIQSTRLIQELAKTLTVAAATEGSFGTLPDGILMYLHKADVSNIYVEGVGYPVKTIPDNFRLRANNFEKQLLIVNSHRQELDLDHQYLIAQYCRPSNAPCLEIWDIKNYLITTNQSTK